MTKYFYEKDFWTGVIVILASISIFIWSKFRQNVLVKDSGYVRGISLGISGGVYGHLYLYYNFHLFIL